MLNEGLTTLGEHDIYSDGYSEKTCGVFQESGLEEITLPSTLTTVGCRTFADCYSLRVVWVGDGCTLNIWEHIHNCMPTYVSVLPKTAMVGDVFLRDLRQLKEVVIPEGVETIESNWFSHSDVESVTIPKSSKVIEQYAFYECEKLKRISF